MRTKENLENLQDFFNWSVPFIMEKWTMNIDRNKTRQHYINIMEDIISFFNDYNPEEYDLRDARKCSKRIDEIIEEMEEEERADRADWNHSNWW